MSPALNRRLAELERRQPLAPRRVAIIVEGQPRPADADLVIVIKAVATSSSKQIVVS